MSCFKSNVSINNMDQIKLNYPEAINYDNEIKSLAIKWSLQRGNRTGRTGWQFIIQLASDRDLKLNF